MLWSGPCENPERYWGNDLYFRDHATGAITNVTRNIDRAVGGGRMNARGDVTWFIDPNPPGPDVCVYSYDRQAGTATCLSDGTFGPAGFYNQSPAIGDAGDIAWSACFWDGDPGSGCQNEIVMYSAATRIVVRLTNDSEVELGTRVNARGDAVWASTQGVFLYDGATSMIIQLTTSGSAPALNATGDVAWVGGANGALGDIYVYSHASATTNQLTFTGNNWEPAINDRGDVAWYNDPMDIFALDAESGTVRQLTNTTIDLEYFPHISRYGDLVWDRMKGDTYIFEIDRAKKGTVAIKSAKHNAPRGELTVTATSARGAGAALEVAGLGPMTLPT